MISGERLAPQQRDLEGTGPVIVHGDFGPQNMLFDDEVGVVVAILDWESAHLGSPVEDLAWAEWLIRTHHPDAITALPSLFEGSGLWLTWSDRKDAMVRQCRSLLDYCESAGMSRAAADWAERLEVTKRWQE